MQTTIRRPLLIVAAVFGVLQLRFLTYVPDLLKSIWQDYVVLPSFLYTFGNICIIPTAIFGILAAVRAGQPNASRILAGISAGISAAGLIALAIADTLNGYSVFSSLKFNLGIASVSYFSHDRYFFLAGTLAMILFAVCAIIPVSETGAAVANSYGAPVYSPPPTFALPQTPQIPTSVNPQAPSAGAKFCSGCGIMLAGSGKFCSSCGAQV